MIDFARDSRAIPRREQSGALAREVAVLRHDRAVIYASVQTRQFGHDVAILFDLETDRLCEEPANPIREVEPLAFVYSGDGVGLRAPAIYSRREDFPRDITHIHSARDHHPVSICVAREGHEAVYERFGVRGVLERLCSWLRDAKTGSLDKNDWEPVPLMPTSILGIADSGACQNLAQGAGTQAWALSLATRNHSKLVVHLDDCLVRGGPDASLRVKQALGTHRCRESAGSDHRIVPAVFVWQPPGQTERRPVLRPCTTGAELQALLEELGLDIPFAEAIQEWSVEEVGLDRELLLLVGVRRPCPIAWDRFGLSSDPVARSLELCGYLIDRRGAQLGVPANSRVTRVELMHPVNRKLLASVSGFEPHRGVTLLGYGALGSMVGEYLARMGTGEVHVVDRDTLHPHNLARHSGTRFDVGMAKAELHRRIQLVLGWMEPSASTGDRIDLSKATGEQLRSLGAQDKLVIDATASDTVRRVLASRDAPYRICRIEIYDHGRLGVQGLEGEGKNPDLFDLYYFLCGLSRHDDAVRGWLREETRARGEVAEAFASGFGCASPTVKMPQWVIASHGAAFMPLIATLVAGGTRSAGVGINPLSQERAPLGWRWFDVPVFRTHDERGWQVRIHPDVHERIRELSKRRAPRETGGYLYGGIDAWLRRICVVVAADEPPGTKASPNRLELPSALRSPEERALDHESGHRLQPVGSWHSHPGRPSRMSPEDAATAAHFVELNHDRALPTLLMIVGGTDVSVRVLTGSRKRR